MTIRMMMNDGSVGVPCSHFFQKNNGGEIMRYRVIVLIGLVVVSILGFSMTQAEVSVLKYQLQMPSIVGNALGFRLIGSMDDGAFGLVWKNDNKSFMCTGQILAYNSVFSKWLETGVWEWSKVFFDVFLLVRF